MQTTSDYDVPNLTPAKRASIRAELLEIDEGIGKLAGYGSPHGLSATVASQVIETAVSAIDAVDRLDALAAKFEAEGHTVADAIALEIRNALKGI